MTSRNLEYLYEPRSIAIVGASESEGSIAGAITSNVLADFRGRVDLVNPNRSSILGRPCVRQVTDLAHAPDLALVTSPADGLADNIEALGRLGTRGAVVITDPKRGSMPAASLRSRLYSVVRNTGMRINGPNCLGLAVPDIGLHATMSRVHARAGNIAYVGQSATAAGPLIDWANLNGLGFSHVISLGDMVDIDYADVLFHLAESNRTRVIVLYAERLPNARRFLSAARHAARIKPVIVMKAGALTGDYLDEGTVIDPALPRRDAVYDAAFRRAGILRVRTLEALFDAVEALSVRLPGDAPRRLGDRLAVLANGESIGTLAIDSLAEKGANIAQLAPETIQQIGAIMPPGRPRTNPVDILPDANSDRYAGALEALMGDKGVDAVLVLSGPTGIASGVDTAKAVTGVVERARQRAGRRRPWVITSWPGGEEALAARKVFQDAHIPSFETPSTAVGVYLAIQRHRMVSEALRETPASIPATFAVDTPKARRILRGARDRRLRDLGYSETEDVLRAYGLKPARSDVAPISPFEWRLTTAVDPEFGPVIIFGLGGATGRLVDKPIVALPPLNQTLARDVIRSHPAGERLFAHTQNTSDDQGGPDTSEDLATLDAMALILMQAAQMLIDLEDLGRLTLEGLMLWPDGMRWTDAALEVVSSPEEAALPHRRPCIRPYPKDLERPFATGTGLQGTMRPVRPEDEPALITFMSQLDPEDIRMRFFRPMKKIDHAFMAGLTQIDYDWHMAFVLTGPGLPGTAEIYGVVRLVRDHREDTAEYSVIIRSDLKGHRVGRMLMERVIEYAREIGLKGIFGLVLAENEPMLNLNRKLGFEVRRDPEDPGVMRVELDLSGNDTP